MASTSREISVNPTDMIATRTPRRSLRFPGTEARRTAPSAAAASIAAGTGCRARRDAAFVTVEPSRSPWTRVLHEIPRWAHIRIHRRCRDRVECFPHQIHSQRRHAEAKKIIPDIHCFHSQVGSSTVKRLPSERIEHAGFCRGKKAGLNSRNDGYRWERFRQCPANAGEKRRKIVRNVIVSTEKREREDTLVRQFRSGKTKKFLRVVTVAISRQGRRACS